MLESTAVKTTRQGSSWETNGQFRWCQHFLTPAYWGVVWSWDHVCGSRIATLLHLPTTGTSFVNTVKFVFPARKWKSIFPKAVSLVPTPAGSQTIIQPTAPP